MCLFSINAHWCRHARTYSLLSPGPLGTAGLSPTLLLHPHMLFMYLSRSGMQARVLDCQKSYIIHFLWACPNTHAAASHFSTLTGLWHWFVGSTVHSASAPRPTSSGFASEPWRGRSSQVWAAHSWGGYFWVRGGMLCHPKSRFCCSPLAAPFLRWLELCRSCLALASAVTALRQLCSCGGEFSSCVHINMSCI